MDKEKNSEETFPLELPAGRAEGRAVLLAEEEMFSWHRRC